MIRVEMLVPVRDNQGHSIDPNAIGRHFHDILKLCGGYTRSEPNLTGCWIDDGKVYADCTFSLVVCCSEDKLPALRTIAGQIADTCRQKCLYFEYHPITLEFVAPC